jgi:hypothetical protein
MRFEFFTTLNVFLLVFLVLTPYGLAARYQYFGGTYRLSLEGLAYVGIPPRRLNTDRVPL